MTSEYARFEHERPGDAGPKVDGSCVRPATSDDVETVVAITAARQRVEPDSVRERIRNEILGMERGEPWLLIVAEVDAGVVGFGRVRHLEPDPDADGPTPPDGWYLAGVVVTPSARRRGIAHALTAARLVWIRERADEAWYFVNRTNRTSIALHERFAFELVGEVGHVRSRLAPDEGLLFRLRL